MWTQYGAWPSIITLATQGNNFINSSWPHREVGRTPLLAAGMGVPEMSQLGAIELWAGRC